VRVLTLIALKRSIKINKQREIDQNVIEKHRRKRTETKSERATITTVQTKNGHARLREDFGTSASTEGEGFGWTRSTGGY